MNAMEWLARQLVWEHRLVELRTERHPAAPASHEDTEQRKAA
jgi:hypothetical protein